MSTVGAILAGGASRRMGRTKALIEIDGRPMVARVADALAAGGCTEVVVVGGDPAALASLGMPLVEDRYPGEGPLGGVVSVLRRAEIDDVVVVVACDLAYLDGDVVRDLLAVASERPDADVVIARTGRIHPTCAVWRAASCDAIEQLFATGVRAMHGAIEQLRTVEVDVEPSALVNLNRPVDLPGQ